MKGLVAMMLRGAALIGCILLGGCERCDRGVPSGLRAEGETPYVRCLAGDPPEARKWRVGYRSFAVEGRTLTVGGLPPSTRIAAYSGPGFASDSPESAFKRMAAARPHLGLMVGGVGDRPDTASRTLALAAKLDFPTLVLAGGRDSWKHLRAAFADLDAGGRDRVIDITAFREVRLGREVLVPVAGAPAGRYSLHDDACGFDAEDLKGMKGVGEPGKGERRWLVSWAAPAESGETPGVARTGQGIDLGDADLASLAESVGAPGGIFAWPRVQVMRPRASVAEGAVAVGPAYPDLRIVVPRIAGPPAERDDETRMATGFALLRFSKEGLGLETRARPGEKPDAGSR
jgi:hypothetical protein